MAKYLRLNRVVEPLLLENEEPLLCENGEIIAFSLVDGGNFLLEDGDKLELEPIAGASAQSAYCRSGFDTNASTHAYTEGASDVRVTNTALMIEVAEATQIRLTNTALMIEVYPAHQVPVWLEGVLGFERLNKSAYSQGQWHTSGSSPALAWGCIHVLDNTDVYVHGKITTYTDTKAYTHGWLTTSGSVAAYAKGLITDSKSVYMFGISEKRATAVDLNVEYFVTQKQSLSSIVLNVEYFDIADSSIHAYLNATTKFSVSWTAVVIPGYIEQYTSDDALAYTGGLAIASDSISAYLIGFDTAEDSISAFVAAWLSTSGSVASYTRGQVDVLDHTDAYVHSGYVSSGSAPAYMPVLPSSRIHAYAELYGEAVLTSAGVNVETIVTPIKRQTAAGINVEYYDAPLTRMSAAGVLVEYELGAEQVIFLTTAGVIIEWERRMSMFGPDAWTI